MCLCVWEREMECVGLDVQDAAFRPVTVAAACG